MNLGKLTKIGGPICGWHQCFCLQYRVCLSVTDLGGARNAPPPLGVQILSISCSFWENLAKWYVGAPPWELAPPPRGNPGFATVYTWWHVYFHVHRRELNVVNHHKAGNVIVLVTSYSRRDKQGNPWSDEPVEYDNNSHFWEKKWNDMI